MIDLKLIRTNPEIVKEALEKRGEDTSVLERIRQLDEARRDLLYRVEQLKSLRNSTSEKIGQLKKAGKDAQDLVHQMRQVGRRSNSWTERFGKLKRKSRICSLIFQTSSQLSANWQRRF